MSAVGAVGFGEQSAAFVVAERLQVHSDCGRDLSGAESVTHAAPAELTARA